MGEWSELPADLVRTIEERLSFYQDKVRCRCICSSWRSALPEMPHQKRHLLPWLLVPIKNKNRAGTSFGFFDPLEKKDHCLQLSDPQGKGMLFRGSSHGWIVNVENNTSICLINPLTGAQVQLPPRFKFPDVKNYRPNKPGNEYGIRVQNGHGFYTLSRAQVRTYLTEKIILSSSPQSEDFVAVALYGELSQLAYCKLGDRKWTFLDGVHCYSEILFHRGELYALSGNGAVMVVDIHLPFPKMMKFASPPPCDDVTCKLYLVESSAGLIMVERLVACEEAIDASKGIFIYKTHGFRIFKLDTSNREWYQVKDTGEDMLFVGCNSSLSISCHHFP
ncbi:hypothetical protein CRYUN_Cryun24cG0002500 [Craigia yunnanensis]